MKDITLLYTMFILILLAVFVSVEYVKKDVGRAYQEQLNKCVAQLGENNLEMNEVYEQLFECRKSFFDFCVLENNSVSYCSYISNYYFGGVDD